MENSNQKSIVCFGELLFHFAPDVNGDWLDNQSLKIYVGGAEYNVASALARWRNPVKLLSALPQNYLGNQLKNRLQEEGISVYSDKQNGRIGTFYLPSDGDMQNAGVVYDRFPSVFTESDFSSINYDELFANSAWLHISTITPALSDDAFARCLDLMKEAKDREIKVSLDLNYRSSLWEYKNPVEVVSRLMAFVNVLMGNIWSIQQFLDIKIEYELNENFDDPNLLKQAELSAKKVQEKYPNVEVVANTFRFTEGDEVNYYATLFDGNQLLVSKKYYAEKVEERVGSGDSFMAALIHGTLRNRPTQQILDDATKVAFKKLFVKGDTINHTINIENL